MYIYIYICTIQADTCDAGLALTGWLYSITFGRDLPHEHTLYAVVRRTTIQYRACRRKFQCGYSPGASYGSLRSQSPHARSTCAASGPLAASAPAELQPDQSARA